MNSAEELLGDVEPVYDYDAIAFETAEAFANQGGRFAFNLFAEPPPSRSQEYAQAARRALTAALEKIR